MANEYYERLSEMNPGELADGLAMEAEFDAISQGFSKLPTPHIGGQGFDGPVRVGDAVNTDEAVSLGQLNAAIGEAVLLPIATYGNLSAAAWETLPSNTYLLFGTGAQFSNTPYTLVAGSTYHLQVRHVIGGAGVAIYHDQLSLASTDDASNIDLRRLFVRTGSTFANANAGGWAGFTLKKAALTALESLAPAVDQLAYYTGAGSAAMTSLTAFARSILDDASAAAVLSTLDIADAYKKRNVIGPVGQSGGVPTGSMIESGSNANGTYVKFADGTMICLVTRTFPEKTLSPYSLYRLGSDEGASSWNWPAAFTATPSMSYGQVSSYSYGIKVAGEYVAANAYGNFHLSNVWNSNLATDTTLCIVAIGRWY